MRALILAALLLASCDSAPKEPQLGRVKQATLDDGAADSLFGQVDLDHGDPPAITAANTLGAPIGVATDPLFRVGANLAWVVDRDANRILRIFGDTTSVSSVIGQKSWTADKPNDSDLVPSASGFDHPSAVAVGGGASIPELQYLAVADTQNHRVLVGTGFATGFWTATTVIGQSTFAAHDPNGSGDVSDHSLLEPRGVAFDADSAVPDRDPRLYVGDTGNNRVLVFNLGATNAAFCIGQPDCTSGAANRGGAIGADTLSGPTGIATWNVVSDPSRGFYVADTGNHRVLHFKSIATKADVVYGQGDDFTTGVASKGGVSASSLNAPTAVALDPKGGLYVADTGHHRVLHFPKGKTVADRVYGQPDFVTATEPTAASATSLLSPSGVAVLPSGDLLVADTGFHRLLHYVQGCPAEGCDDFNPCTDDYCDPARGCQHLASLWPLECNGYRCSATGHECEASCPGTGFGWCKSPLSCINGRCAQTCSTSTAASCESGICADSFCCNRPCNGPCERCDLPGYEGTCRPIEGRPRPDRTCGTTIAGECGSVCNGKDGSTCAIMHKDAPCGVESCKDGVQSSRGGCDGFGGCVYDTVTCAPYTCGAATCRTSCAFDYECVAGNRCISGACVPSVGAQSGGGGCAFGMRGPGAFAALLVGFAVLSRRRR